MHSRPAHVRRTKAQWCLHQDRKSVRFDLYLTIELKPLSVTVTGSLLGITMQELTGPLMKMQQGRTTWPSLILGIGYGVVVQDFDRVQIVDFLVGVGFFFTFVMLCLTVRQPNFSRITPSSSEELTSAPRSVKVPGLVCRDMWYGAGGSIQVAMFRMVTAKVNMNASSTHTFLEALGGAAPVNASPA
ncbi:hypothetical protein BDR06DRAFT_977142 [Suillus hirtellus]|nr:hypothetical protein BDR06DRAFT_977142 [Suillus hirtellus]